MRKEASIKIVNLMIPGAGCDSRGEVHAEMLTKWKYIQYLYLFLDFLFLINEK